MKKAIVTRYHLGADNKPMMEGDKVTLDDNQFAELRKRGLVEADRTKAAKPPANKAAPRSAKKTSH